MALSTYLVTNLAQTLREGELKIRKVNQDLERLSEMRRTFLHVGLHDLRSPAAAVWTLLNNLASGLGGPLSAKQTHWIERAQLRCRGMIDVLRDLQILGELEGLSLAAHGKVLEVAELLRAVAEEYRDQAEQKRQVLKLELPEDLGRVRAIERLLHEAVANYLTNAIKYGPEDRPITLRAVALFDAVRIEVQDEGKGIAPEQQAKLFQEYSRLSEGERSATRTLDRPPETERSTATAGGLGLSIVRRIAEAHHGRVGVISRPEAGCMFFIEIPRGEV
jgi:signal transduction histidine kinase